MASEVWKALLKRIPVELHPCLMTMTSAGSEINFQAILRMDEDFMLVRGRLAGTLDMGRIFFIAYEEIDHIGFIKELTDAQLEPIFGDGRLAAAPTKTALAPAAAPVPETAAEAPAVVASNSRPRVRLPSKSEIMERLRMRSAIKEEEKT